MRLLFLLLLLAAPLAAKDIPVADAAAWSHAAANARPGDTLILAAGEWKNAQLAIHAIGTAEAPITVRAATAGQTVFTGESSFSFSGNHLVVEGLSFKDPDPKISRLIEFRTTSAKAANNSRLTNCAVVGTQPLNASQESQWVGIYGSGNRVDRCTFQGKTTKGALLVVWLGQGSGGEHRIDHNYFGPREKLGMNGGETIRIGDSRTSMLPAKCIVENNLFEKCNGEVECISNKSCENIYRGNTSSK